MGSVDNHSTNTNQFRSKTSKNRLLCWPGMKKIVLSFSDGSIKIRPRADDGTESWHAEGEGRMPLVHSDNCSESRDTHYCDFCPNDANYEENR